MSRSTLTDLFHLSASVLLPLSRHLLQCIAAAEVVWADETPLRVLDVKKTRLGYLWTFLTQNERGEWLIGYRFNMGRGGKTPLDVLGGTTGALVVDGYTGYNPVTLPDGRTRVGCWAHARRPGAVYFALWLAPDPVLSKGIAATLTVALIAYLGWDTVWSLVEGWRVLVLPG